MLGVDVNKPDKPEIPELGGIATLFAFATTLSLIVGFQKLVGNVSEPPFLAAIAVFFIAATIGLIDDISNLQQRVKAVAVVFAALPLLLVHYGEPVIDLPFGFEMDLRGYYLLYWIVLVPIGVTGLANAMNMSAGYNGLESGQIAIISAAMLSISVFREAAEVSTLVFASTLGCSLALYIFNRSPARTFVGDIGTLGLGAAMAAGIILGHLEFYGVVAIAPAFYEGFATVYYGLAGKNGQRREACMSPLILDDGRLLPPAKAEKFTLAFYILSKRSMTEHKLVRVLLISYAVAGTLAFILSVL